MLTRENLHGYQHKAVQFIKDNPKAALWIDMGLGKTVSTLTALSDLAADENIKRTLVIAPLRVATHTWPTEISNWSHIDLRYTVIAGKSAAKRSEALDEDTDLHIINRENIPWLVEQFGQRWPYDCVVIDESSSFKSHSSKRWKSLRKVIGKVKRMIQLTGTPAPNALLELWPQIYLLDKGERLENTRGKFLAKYCTLIGNPQWNQWAVKPDRADAIHKAVADVVLRMKADDYIDLPKRIDVTVPVVLPPKARKIYEDMKRDFLVAYDGGEILSVNAAVQINKLLQISNGNLYTEDGDFIKIHAAKLDALREIVESTNEPLLVAYSYKSDLEILTREFPEAVVIDNDNSVLDKWNNGDIPILLAHPASAGHGLNLQKGGSLIVWYGLSWSLELYQQFNARLHRQGQTKPVRVLHILAENTADNAVLTVLAEKETVQDKLLHVVEHINTTNT
jgi:SNF2 family DNA or RNA helicase